MGRRVPVGGSMAYPNYPANIDDTMILALSQREV